MATISPSVVLWTNRKIPYLFDPSVPPEKQTIIRQAMSEWEAAAGVNFVPRLYEDIYVLIVWNKGTGSAAGAIGMPKVPSTMTLNGAKKAWHELGHTLGLMHEQCRSDRDRYVTVQSQDPRVDMGGFVVDPLSRNLSDYDLFSIMHYPSPSKTWGVVGSETDDDDDSNLPLVWTMRAVGNPGEVIGGSGAGRLTDKDACLRLAYNEVPMPLAQGTPFLVQKGAGADVVHLVYRDVTNRITDLTWGGGTRWSYYNLHELADYTSRTPGGTTPIVVGNPSIAQYGPAALHCVFRDFKSVIGDISYNGGNWTYTDLGLTQEAPSAAGDPCVIQFGGDLYVLYRDSVGHIAILWWTGTQWTYLDDGKKAPIAKGDPYAVVGGDKLLHCVYWDENDHITDFSSPNGLNWSTNDLTRTTGAAETRGRPSITASQSNRLDCVYRDVNDEISDIYGYGGWSKARLSHDNNAPNAAGDPLIVRLDPAFLHCVYRDQNDQIADVTTSPTGKWTYVNASAVARVKDAPGKLGAAPAAGDPAVATWRGVALQIAYRTPSGRLSNISFYNGLWDTQML